MLKKRNILLFTAILSLFLLFNCSQDKANAPLTHWQNPYSRSEPLYHYWNYCFADVSFEDGNKYSKNHCTCKAKQAESFSHDEQVALTFLFERLSPYYSSDYERLNANGTVDDVRRKLKNIKC